MRTGLTRASARARPQLESLGALSRRVQAGSKKGQGVPPALAPDRALRKVGGALRDPQSKRHGRASVSEKRKGPPASSQEPLTSARRWFPIPKRELGHAKETAAAERLTKPISKPTSHRTHCVTICGGATSRRSRPIRCRHATGRCRWEVVSLRRPTAATSSIRSTTRIRKTLRRATTSARSTGWMVPCGRADEAIKVLYAGVMTRRASLGLHELAQRPRQRRVPVTTTAQSTSGMRCRR